MLGWFDIFVRIRGLDKLFIGMVDGFCPVQFLGIFGLFVCISYTLLSLIQLHLRKTEVYI